ncbi:serine/arginine repetitive matrix protein 2-like [Malaya genurostris]|uniref:serine/arginine repetitive matrix protein 2-like n=1 Tax=Malaya genurostris TaxID=325434 RepID=UPI0026F3D212|nr:serine/arginine repetitive matrix protein 2-like [Malaya genurostris]XP_058446012.1 serine/arginine repetitive matrix protein 2-like [Malaya genurostris]
MSEVEKMVEQKLAEARKVSEKKGDSEQVDSKKESSEKNSSDSKNAKDGGNKQDLNGKDKKPSDSVKKSGDNSQNKEKSSAQNSSNKNIPKSDNSKPSNGDTAKKTNGSTDSKNSNSKTSSSKNSSNSSKSNSSTAGKSTSKDSSKKESADKTSTSRSTQSSSSKNSNSGKSSNTSNQKSSNSSDKKNISSKTNNNDSNKKGSSDKNNANSTTNKTSSDRSDKSKSNKKSDHEKSSKDSKPTDTKNSWTEDLWDSDNECLNSVKNTTDGKNGPDVPTKTADTERVKDKSRSTSKTKRDRSLSPITFRRRRPSTYIRRRSPPRFGRSSPRRRSRSPIDYRDSRRWSPRRRSRSPARRSRSRPRFDRSRSPDKALIAKKSFLDDLAIQFALEGKEFPELEQYRCATNSQFISRPPQSYSQHSLEHMCSGNFDEPMFRMGVGPQMEKPPMMFPGPFNPNPYNYGPNVFPEPGIELPPAMDIPSRIDIGHLDMRPAIEVPSLISYPIAGMQAHLDSTDFPEACDNVKELTSSQSKGPSKNKVLVESASPVKKYALLGSQPPEKFPIAKVKSRVLQALDLLDDLDSKLKMTGRFRYRTPTFYENDVHENRSPVVQSPTNPQFTFNSRTGESSDPFGNVPRSLKVIIEQLHLDEGLISQKIFDRRQKLSQVVSRYREKIEQEERLQRLLPKVTLQKNTQTDPTVCTDCLLRMIKVKTNSQTQTNKVSTVDSVAQTNPMPVQTVSEFGSITELTPNQVRAVSELIKYIKLTATSGTLMEMRNSMRDDQVYNLNSDLRTAYTLFDAMVEHKHPTEQPQEIHEDLGPIDNQQPADDFEDIVHYDNDNGNLHHQGPIDEYEEYHRNFCDDEQDTDMFHQDRGNFTQENYEDNVIQDDFDPRFERRTQSRRPMDFDSNPMNARTFNDQPFGPADGSFMASSRNSYGRGRGGGMSNARGYPQANWN